MQPRDWLVRIEDILEACQRIIEYVGTSSEEGFQKDPKTVDAVVRNLTVIGEAAILYPEGSPGTVRPTPVVGDAGNPEYCRS